MNTVRLKKTLFYGIQYSVVQVYLTLSHPEALHWQVKSSGIRQSKITKGMVLAGLGEERLIQLYYF